jgi:hypothetical protein
VWSLPLGSSSRHPFYKPPLQPATTRTCHPKTPILIGVERPQRQMLPAPKLPLTTVLRVVVSQPRLSRLLAFIQRHPFPVSQLPQPG